MVWATAIYLPTLNEAYDKWDNAKKEEREEVVAETVKQLRDVHDKAAKADKRVRQLPENVSKA
jgi:hypothetical protein